MGGVGWGGERRGPLSLAPAAPPLHGSEGWVEVKGVSAEVSVRACGVGGWVRVDG